MRLNNKDFVLSVMKRYGKEIATELQNTSDGYTNDELYERSKFIPSFTDALRVKNMLERKIGFMCVSPAGSIVKLIQPYDSDIYPQEPEELVAQWGFKWSTDPAKAKPFISSATSPYGYLECCIENEKIFRSKINNNTWAPSTTPALWEEVEEMVN